MESSYALLALFSLLLFAGFMEGRKEPAGELWKEVTKDGSVFTSSSLVKIAGKNSDCHDQNLKHEGEELFVKDFEPRPNVSSYPDNDKEKILVVEFESRPNSRTYPEEIKSRGEVLGKNKNPSFFKDFEPRPDVTNYHG